MSEYPWQPSAGLILKANLSRLMRRMGHEVFVLDREATTRAVRDFVRDAQRDPASFWQAALDDMHLDWSRSYSELLECTQGADGTLHPRWFVGGETQIALNCLDRHLEGAQAGKTALIVESADGESRRFAYVELAAEVARVANALGSLGVGPGQRVASVMPLVAEAVFAMLATMKLGAVFVPLAPDAPAEELRARLQRVSPSVVLTADATLGAGLPRPLKARLDPLLEGLEGRVEGGGPRHVVVYERAPGNVPCPMRPGRDRPWDTWLAGASVDAATLPVAAMAPALIVFARGVGDGEGEQSALVHSHAGCLAQAGKEFAYNLDLRSTDVVCWLPEMGTMSLPWAVIGCLQHAGTLLLVEEGREGVESDRVWQMLGRHGVTVFGAGAATLRRLLSAGLPSPDSMALQGLRVLGVSGAPLDAVHWQALFAGLGRRRCPVIQLSAEPALFGSLLVPVPLMPLRVVSLQGPGLGMDVTLIDGAGRGRSRAAGGAGELSAGSLVPSLARPFGSSPGQGLAPSWRTGKRARVDADGLWYLD